MPLYLHCSQRPASRAGRLRVGVSVKKRFVDRGLTRLLGSSASLTSEAAACSQQNHHGFHCP